MFSTGFSGKDAPTAGVGTCTYASPEQLRNNIYDNKVGTESYDIFFLSFFNPKKTDHDLGCMTFPAFVAGLLFPRACYKLHSTYFPGPFTGTCLMVHFYQSHRSAFTALVTYFPRVLQLVTSACLNRNELYRCYIFPRSLLVTSFPVFITRFMFFRTCYLLHVFPRLFPVTCFPAWFSDFNLTAV